MRPITKLAKRKQPRAPRHRPGTWSEVAPSTSEDPGGFALGSGEGMNSYVLVAIATLIVIAFAVQRVALGHTGAELLTALSVLASCSPVRPGITGPNRTDSCLEGYSHVRVAYPRHLRRGRAGPRLAPAATARRPPAPGHPDATRRRRRRRIDGDTRIVARSEHRRCAAQGSVVGARADLDPVECEPREDRVSSSSTPTSGAPTKPRESVCTWVSDPLGARVRAWITPSSPVQSPPDAARPAAVINVVLTRQAEILAAGLNIVGGEGAGHEAHAASMAPAVRLRNGPYRQVPELLRPGRLEPDEVAPGWDEWHTALEGTHTTPYYDYRLHENGQAVDYGSSKRDYITRVLNDKAVNLIHQYVPGPKPLFLSLDQVAPHSGPNRDPRCHNAPLPYPARPGQFEHTPLPESPAFNEADVSDKPRFVRMTPRLSATEIAGPSAGQRMPARLAPGGGPGRRAHLRRAARGGRAEQHRDPLHLRQRLPPRPAPRGGEGRPLRGLAPRAAGRSACRRDSAGAAGPADALEHGGNVDLAPNDPGSRRAQPCPPAGACRVLDGRSLLPAIQSDGRDWPRHRALPLELDGPGESGEHALRLPGPAHQRPGLYRVPGGRAAEPGSGAARASPTTRSSTTT